MSVPECEGWADVESVPAAGAFGEVLGTPLRCEELTACDVLNGLGDCTICVNDPPWSALSSTIGLGASHRVVPARDMDIACLEQLAAEPDDNPAVVGFGGGTALDTAKFWPGDTTAASCNSPPSRPSTRRSPMPSGYVTADGSVTSATSRPSSSLDLDLVRAAPAHLNRPGIGDVFSCHTGLFDWRLAAASAPVLGRPTAPWDDQLAAHAENLLDGLDAAAADIAAVTVDGIRFLVDAYRLIGAACARAGHSRFEEGSEHFFAYAYEYTTGAHPVHGEIVSLAVCALAHVQDNDPAWARDIIVTPLPRAEVE